MRSWSFLINVNGRSCVTRLSFILIFYLQTVKMVLMDSLANALKSINNAEKRGKRQVRFTCASDFIKP